MIEGLGVHRKRSGISTITSPVGPRFLCLNFAKAFHLFLSSGILLNPEFQFKAQLRGDIQTKLLQGFEGLDVAGGMVYILCDDVQSKYVPCL